MNTIDELLAEAERHAEDIRDIRASLAYITTEAEKARVDRDAALDAQRRAETVLVRLRRRSGTVLRTHSDAEVLAETYHDDDMMQKGS